jgi:hypothetical protein
MTKKIIKQQQRILHRRSKAQNKKELVSKKIKRILSFKVKKRKMKRKKGAVD